MTWPEAFRQVGIAACLAVVAYFWIRLHRAG
jgi:diacylglycerol kinase